MKTKFYFLLALASLAIVVAGCVNTVSGNKTAAFPFVKDRVEGRYERPLEQVFSAAQTVIRSNGSIETDGAMHNTTNAVKFIVAKVKQCNVWVRVEALEPRLTSVIVQARTTKGTSHLPLAHELDKEIALQLAR